MTAPSGPARPTDPAEALAVLREIVAIDGDGPADSRHWRDDWNTIINHARALVAGAAAPAGGDEPHRCGDNACWPSRPERACIRHVDHQGEHENRDGKTWISPGRALRERDELRRTVAGAAAPAGDTEPVETREEWGYRWSSRSGRTLVRRVNSEAEAREEVQEWPDRAAVMVVRRTVTVTTSPWVAVPDPADTTSTED